MRNLFKNADISARLKDYQNLRELFYEDMDENRQNLIDMLERYRNGEELAPWEVKQFAEDLLNYYKRLTGNSHPQIEQIVQELQEI